jgi:hypothetical protein
MAIEVRYGPLEWDTEASSYTGFRLQCYSDASLTIDQTAGYIAGMLTDLGANDLPYVSKPILDYFFDPQTSTTPIIKNTINMLLQM